MALTQQLERDVRDLWMSLSAAESMKDGSTCMRTVAACVHFSEPDKGDSLRMQTLYNAGMVGASKDFQNFFVTPNGQRVLLRADLGDNSAFTILAQRMRQR